jgi:hypothetical protein
MHFMVSVNCCRSETLLLTYVNDPKVRLFSVLWPLKKSYKTSKFFTVNVESYLVTRKQHKIFKLKAYTVFCTLLFFNLRRCKEFMVNVLGDKDDLCAATFARSKKK